jgi:hypothetical protein
MGLSGARAEPANGVFEQVHEGPRGAWRSRGTRPEIFLLPNGFVVRQGTVTRGFRWDRSMRLDRLDGEEPVVSNSYLLSGPSGAGRVLPHAMLVRATSRDRKFSVVYYFGKRGLEFDIQLEPGAGLSKLRLESLDGDFSLSGTGQLRSGDDPLWLKPVAYTLDANNRRHIISSSFQLKDRRHLAFQVDRYNPSDRLVVDPVLTYATYFGGSGDTSPIALREMPDGSVLFAGNTNSIDLPQGVSLNGQLIEPSGSYLNKQCFVASLSPAKRRSILSPISADRGLQTAPLWTWIVPAGFYWLALARDHPPLPQLEHSIQRPRFKLVVFSRGFPPMARRWSIQLIWGLI